MSWDISVDADPCKECGQARGVDVGNMTWNVAPVYDEAMGFSLGALNGVQAAVALPALDAGYAKIKAAPEAYRHLVRGGGDWGTVEGALEYLHRLADACRAMPDGKVRVS